MSLFELLCSCCTGKKQPAQQDQRQRSSRQPRQSSQQNRSGARSLRLDSARVHQLDSDRAANNIASVRQIEAQVPAEEPFESNISVQTKVDME